MHGHLNIKFMLVVCAIQWVVTLKPTGIFEGEENGPQSELQALSTHKWKLYGKNPYPTTVGYRSFGIKYQLRLGYGSKGVEQFLT